MRTAVLCSGAVAVILGVCSCSDPPVDSQSSPMGQPTSLPSMMPPPAPTMTAPPTLPPPSATVPLPDAAVPPVFTPDAGRPRSDGAVPSVEAGAMPPEDLSVAPEWLSQTGLFADMATQALGAGVEAYEPRFKLWSDGAEKRRWIRIPPGAQIDTTDMDLWRFPVGTKIWKEFAKDGRALETRYIAKHGPLDGDWVFMAYEWDPGAGDAHAVPDGVANTAGTEHDIPSDLTCLQCHNGLPDAALGVSAIQLSHDGGGVTLNALAAAGRLTDPPAAPLTVPGDVVESEALGYLHANCGHCHNPNGGKAFTKNPAVIFWLTTAALGSVAETSTYVAMVENTDGDLTRLIDSVDRMKSRPEDQMPPVATEKVDEQGVAAVDAWVQRLRMQFPDSTPQPPELL